jgi:glutamine synthetase
VFKLIFKLDEHPWYGIEQEFFLMDRKTKLPVGFGYRDSENDYCPPEPQGQYYCGVGSENAFEREYVLEVYKTALRTGLKISGLNAEVAPGQWEIQVGPCEGIDAGDQLWILRYIMHRLTEGKSFYVELHAKPIGHKPVQDIAGSWNGSGAHCNFSTEKMRLDGGYDYILQAVEKLGSKHLDHIQVYGTDNSLRMTGKHETSDINMFSYSVGGRNVSIRIPFQVVQNKKGYLEDRRPSSSCDPYTVTSKLLHTVCN